MTRQLTTLLLSLCLLASTLGCGRDATEAPQTASTAETPPAGVVATLASSASTTLRLDVGLSAEEEALWHHHDEGSGFIPLSFFHALRDSATGRPFLEVLPRFGFVSNPDNPYGLPIGFSAAPVAGAPTQSVLVGVSCAACHSGQYTYGDTALTIDGAPNMLDFEELLASLEGSLKETLASPSRTFEFLTELMHWEREINAERRALELHPEAHGLVAAAAGATEDHPLASARAHLETSLHEAFHADSTEARQSRLASAAEGLDAVAAPADSEHGKESAWQHLRAALPKMHDDLEYVKRRAERLFTLAKAFAAETPGGPGRADSFDSIWDLLVQHDNLAPMNAPVSIPHLFEYASFHWVHWDGNSSAVMGRDYAQAIALGADYNPETQETSVLPHNVIALEATAHQLVAPAWPTQVLGAIDADRASRGEALYGQHCLSCHQQETLTPVDEIGTDPLRAVNFANLEQDGKSYAQLLIELGDAVGQKSMDAHGVTPEELAPIERSADPTWRITHAYHTRQLAGIWASPPYLHNGSVPTLWDLLQPASARPASFPVGRELDPEKVGLSADGQGEGAWVFDSATAGNANTGHEYGVELSDDDKWALVEYMKTL
ncbi:MAG: hypothetical protein AAF560_20470 [Acidobacteriota bacterium]